MTSLDALRLQQLEDQQAARVCISNYMHLCDRLDDADTVRAIGALFSVEDNGPGIPAELHERIFTPYFTTKEAGTGLGLPTVYKIISEAGGEIRVDSSFKGGAQFEITLPVAP